MKNLRSFLKSIHYTIWLGLLTLLLVTAVLPAAARSDFGLGIGNVELEKQEITKSIEAVTVDGEERGRNLFEAGRFSEAAAAWEEALKVSENQSDKMRSAIIFSYLSNAYQELGQWDKAKDAIAKSLNLIENSSSKTQHSALTIAQILNTQASLQLAMGQAETALDTWREAEKVYADAKDEMGKLGSQLNQAQAMQALGLYRRAKTTLQEVNAKLQNLPNSSLKVTGLRSLGITLQAVGDLTKSEEILQQSLAIAKQLNSPTDINATLFSLANTQRSLKKYEAAMALYQEVAKNANDPLTKVECLLNQLSLSIETKQQASVNSILPQIESELGKLSPSRDTIYAQVNFAQSLMKLETRSEEKSTITNYLGIGKLLAKAIEEAKTLKDARAESYAVGELGKLYAQTQQRQEAEQLTKQAIAIAQAISASDILARWQAQLGGILQQQGDIQGAIGSYTEAVNILQSLRSDLVAINPEVQFSFRESVEPIYRQLVALLLQNNPSQENIKQARGVIEALQLAELDNFFREACLNAKPQQIDQIDPQAAVIYPIILSDRLGVILSQPGKPLTYYQTELPQGEIEKTLEQLLESLNPFFSNQDRLRLSQQVYDWLIRPGEAQLAQNKTETLVFVLDGLLRNLPMGALYDGKQYLLEKYNVALTPGLQLLEARSIGRNKFKILSGGITEARQGFSALPGVKLEVEQIALEVPSKIFLNEDFTQTNLQNEIKATPFPVVHLATHGQFSSNPEETFILSWDEKIQVKDFEDVLRAREQGRSNPIELLVLSACQTAAGDKRAALGLAGVAVRSGARSTVATLWSVKDESTAQLMTGFYQELLKGSGKAESLRTAQLALLKQPKYAHPFYWAPFILVGNWL